MRPVSIRFKGFGPYVREQFIDFSQFEKSGLFLICGETGAGKTTILDAMCVALFGRSSGSKPGDLDKMRCKLCVKEDETLVEFIFDSDGRRYKFLRRGIYKTKNFNEDHKCYELRDGVEVLISEKKSQVNQKAEELMGLTCDQFRQVVILPQGEFEKLLTSKSEEKEAILTSLFHAERWSKVAEYVAEQVAARARALNQEKIRMESKLGEYGCKDPEELLAKLESERLTLQESEKLMGDILVRLTACKEAYEQALLENRDFEELDRRKKHLEELERQKPMFAAEERLLAMGEEARTLEPLYTAFLEARNRLLQGKNTVRKAAATLAAAKTAAEAAKAARLAHEQGRQTYSRDAEHKTLLENARQLYGGLGEKRAVVNRLELQWRNAQKTAAAAQTSYERAHSLWADETRKYDDLVRAYLALQESYRKGISGKLAEELTEGQPCPVCGSCVHPNPAPVGETVSDADVDRCHQAMDRQMADVQKAQKTREGAERSREEARKAFEEAARLHAAAKAELESMLERKIPGIESEGELEAAITHVKKRILAYETAEQKTANDVMRTASALSVAEAAEKQAAAELEKLRCELGEKEKVWLEALSASGLGTESAYKGACISADELRIRREKLIRFRSTLEGAQAACAEQTALLQGRERPQTELLKKTRDETEQRYKSLTGQVSVLRSRLEQMETAAKDLQKREILYDEKRQTLDADQEFADRLRGVRGVSLRRYVLGVMLTSITTAANQLLKNVHNGRYQLFRTDNTAGRTMKAGLELEVYDAQNNERRSVTTLSGGEKFLVALSLAIGLSTVVQAQGHGMRLEAMFIDEGFGSLDRESIADALEVLQGIQRSHGIVGIISHVDQLAETIPAKIRIHKSEKGSTCKVCL